MTSSSGSLPMISLSVMRTEALSSTISTRILLWVAVMAGPSGLLEYRGCNLTHGHRGADHGFGMTKNEITAWPQMIDQSHDHLFLVRLVEIDQHVAQEDDVDI